MKSTQLLPLLLVLLLSPARADDVYASPRRQMVETIRDTTGYTSEQTGKSSLDNKVMEVMARVHRHEFVPEDMRRFAYIDQPLPIGARQTISQPYIVALMTDLADVDREDVVLEVGTGSGYQAAVLAELAARVYSIEIVESLGLRARATLQGLGYDNVSVRIGDGYHGWKEHAPFDAIIVTAAPESVPSPLLDQLKPGGRLVIPVGKQSQVQTLKVIEKDLHGNIVERDILPVGFVPFTRDQ